jgi:hypothetical protein
MDVRQANPDLRSRTRSEEESATSGCISLGYFSLGTQREVTRSPQASGSFCWNDEQEQELDSSFRWNDEQGRSWIPAFAGMTARAERARGKCWIPAFAGMTSKRQEPDDQLRC